MIQYKKKIIRAVTVAQSIGFFVEMIPTLNQKEIEVVALSSPGKELDDLREKGVPTIVVPMERHISIFKDMKALMALVKVFRREKPDMVHSMTPKAGLLCMLAAKMAHVPVRVHTFTGLVWPTAAGLKRRILMATDWLTCACATHIIPEGQGVLNDLKNGGITKKPMKVLGYGNVRGVDMVRFSPSRFDVSKNPSAFTFVFVGRIVGDKGINELVEAFVKLHEKHQNARLILVGSYEHELDPLSDTTREQIESNEAIDACGPKYDDDLLRMYVNADCFVMPSYREGFPNTVLEAGAMGLPSIVTDINGSREIIENEKNGLIIPSKNASALYDAMERMLTDDTARETMRSNARPMIASRFEKNFVQKCQIEFYKEITKA